VQTKRDISNIAGLLADQTWVWERRAFEALCDSLGWCRYQTIGHRDSYRTPEGLSASVYYNEDDNPDVLEVGIESFSDVGSLDECAYDDKVDEFYEAFVEGTRQISTKLGDPEFCDGAAAHGFPNDQDAVWLALWTLQSARLMLEQKHEDRDLPFRICLTVAPPCGENEPPKANVREK
jgi:hypothetical protein